MPIKNIEELKRNINVSTIVVFAIIFLLSLAGFIGAHAKFIQNKQLFHQQEIESAGNLYKSNLSEKLSIIASSTVFLDYLRSGDVTKEILYSQFLSQIASLKSESISGMEILDKNKKVIFSYGNFSNTYMSIKLCYLNQTLDHEMGDCQYLWRLFFRKQDLIKEILSINHSISLANTANRYDLLAKSEFGSFSIADGNGLSFPFSIVEDKDLFFYIYLLLLTVALVFFGSWSWYRLNKAINDYIAHPIKKITHSLEDDQNFEDRNNIQEIQYLINQINLWKNKISKIKSDENSARLSKVAAQLAHDVRSPLAVINMLIKDVKNIPEHSRVMLCNATQRISDIANNFLHQYKRPGETNQLSQLSEEHIPSLLESIVSEKSRQYSTRDIVINLSVEPEAWNIFANINPMDFKRIISNLINNSIEAINDSGVIDVVLSRINKSLRITISDNGCGISADFLPEILQGGVSFGKANGSGLGLSHAIEKVSDWNGDFNIESDVGIGTKINIDLPFNTNIPTWSKQSIILQPDSLIVIVDNEPYVHDVWKKILANFEGYFSVKYLSSIRELKDLLSQNTSMNVIYFIDYDFGLNQLNGLEIIKLLSISDRSTLVTNRYDDCDVQKDACALGVKIIPKISMQYFPIAMSSKVENEK